MITGLLQDNYQRQFHYLRLSLTDVCNFKCEYCLPNGYQKQAKATPLQPFEIEQLIRGTEDLGIWKIRLTGGEPTTRKDFLEALSAVSQFSHIRTVALTTNGYLLAKHAHEWQQHGLTHLNVSVDSLNEQRFHQITGQNLLPLVLQGVEKAIPLFNQVKLNAILLKKTWQDELNLFLPYIKDKPITVRFIELMQTGDNFSYYQENHLPHETFVQYLKNKGWLPTIKNSGDGPAATFSHPDYVGQIGLIAPYSKDFCSDCNRLRIDSQGNLKLCLFGDGQFNLRPYLADKTLLVEKILEQLTIKPKTHLLHFMKTGTIKNLSEIGG